MIPTISQMMTANTKIFHFQLANKQPAGGKDRGYQQAEMVRRDGQEQRRGEASGDGRKQRER